MPQLAPLYFINQVSWGYMILGIILIISSKIYLPLNVRLGLIRKKLG